VPYRDCGTPVSLWLLFGKVISSKSRRPLPKLRQCQNHALGSLNLELNQTSFLYKASQPLAFQYNNETDLYILCPPIFPTYSFLDCFLSLCETTIWEGYWCLPRTGISNKSSLTPDLKSHVLVSQDSEAWSRVLQGKAKAVIVLFLLLIAAGGHWVCHWRGEQGT
jgi:hypothetical protein